MTVYAIVQLKMTDRAAYDRYQARFFEVFKKFSGRLLSADENPSVLEGTWNRDKIVLMSFPDESVSRLGQFARLSRHRERPQGRRGRRGASGKRIFAATRERLSASRGSPRLPAIAEERRQWKERCRRVINRAPVIIIRIGRPIDRAIAMPLVAAWADIAGLPLLHRSRSRVSRS